ncbi:serine/threonine-protein kinase ULK4-like [Convolutriloba macropyga]|uniref:serine/threonine-protein kinase ULK4-like n=1 Tax=Convolutriloba macropyga TaxID=536237 RepID=UPI003F5255DA
MENYVLYDEIGRGENTIVYKGRRKGTINFVAIYCIEKSVRAEITNRVRLTHELNHENVVSFHEWYETSNHLWIVVELCTGGTLKQVIEQDQHLPEACIRKFGRCILRGLYYVHSIGIVFSNLTTQKVLLDGEGNLKLSDFTLARVPGEDLQAIFQQTMEDFEELVEVDSSRVSVDKSYAAPEVLKQGLFSQAGDFWSFGCILYEMFTGTTPFSSSSDDLMANLESANFVSPRSKVLSAQHTEKPSREFMNLLNGLIQPDPAKRFDWNSISEHPFWKGNILNETFDRPITLVTGGDASDAEDRGMDTLNASTSKLAQSLRMTQELRSSLRPKTGEDPKLAQGTQGTSVNVNNPKAKVRGNEKGGANSDTQGREPKATLEAAESTTPRDNRAQSTKGDSDCRGTKSTQRASNVNQDSYSLSEWKQLIYTSSDLSTGAIIDNPKISKVLDTKFEAKSLPAPSIGLEGIKALSEDQLKNHVKPFVDVLTPAEKNNTLQKAKLHVASYLMKVSCEALSNMLVNQYRLLNVVVNHVKTNGLQEMRAKYCRLIGIVAQNCSRVNHGTNLMEVIVILTEVLRDSFRNVKIKQSVLPAIGEVLFLIAAQEEKEGSSIDSWTIPSISFTMVTRCLREGEESITQHFAAKIVENIAATSGVHSNKFSTTEVALLLWNLFCHSSNDSLKIVAISALCRINKLNTAIFPSVIDKVGLQRVLDSMAANSKIQQPVLTMFLSMLSNGQHVSRLTQDKDFIVRVMKMLESPIATVRAKFFLLLLIVIENSTEMLVYMCNQRLVVYIERDCKKQMSARADQSQHYSLNYLNQCLEQLMLIIVNTFPVVLQDVVATLDSVSGRKHPSTLQIKQMKATLPLFGMSVFLISSQVFRNRILNEDIVTKLGQLLTHVQMIDSGETCIDSSNSANLSDEFKKTCLGCVESIVQHPQIIVSYCSEMVDGLMPPLSNLVINSDNADIRLMALLLLSEITSEVLSHCLSAETSVVKAIKNRVLSNFVSILVPNFEQILIYQDPMPAYGLKMLANILETFPASIKDIESAGIIPIMFQVLSEHETDLTGTVVLSLVNIFNTIVTTKGANLDNLYELGLADNLCSLFLTVSSNMRSSEEQNRNSGSAFLNEKDLKAVNTLASGILECLQNLLKYASNIVRVTLQQKNANGATDTSKAEALLLRNKVFMQLMSPLIQMLTSTETDIQELACNILFILVQLYGGADDSTDDVNIISSDNLICIRKALQEFDMKKQRILLRFLKRVLSSDRNHVEEFKRSPLSTDMTEAIQKLAIGNSLSGGTNTDVTVSSVAKEILKIIHA